jgi:hypothetical protein
MIEQSERTDDASVYAAKMKRRKVLVGAKKNSSSRYIELQKMPNLD